MTKYECTQKVKRLQSFHTLDELAKKIGITRPTLNSRLSKHNWKVSELTHISNL